jgi:glycosyltransferase involved in cell wall biosynthesis
MEGPPDRLVAFLRGAGADIISIVHPLDRYGGRDTVFTGVGRRGPRRLARHALGPLNLVLDAVLTGAFGLRHRADTFIATTNLDAAAVLLTRRLLRRPNARIIYFGVDYAEVRFGNHVLDWVYRATETLCLRSADLVVSNTRRAESARLARGLTVERSLVIPNGVHRDGAPRAKPIDKSAFVFVGNVTQEHGLHELIEAIGPAIGHLVIIGDGADWDRVVALCDRQQLSYELHRRKTHDFVMAYLDGFNGIGLAPYTRASEWTHFCSPMKVNEYLASGIPVLLSDVPEIAEHVRSRGLGVVYSELDGDTLIDALEEFDAGAFAERAAEFHDQFRSDVLYARIPV